jgi:hypothetical protein
MSTQPIVRRLEERAAPYSLTWRALVVAALGPLTALCGVVWAVVQPYRMTLLHPRGEGLWWLLVEPPLLVIAAGAAFHYFVTRPLLRDLEDG